MHLHWLIRFVRSLHAPITARLGSFVIAMAIYSGCVTVYHVFYPDTLQIHPELHALLGAILGVLLVFRNNTAYERWWEGRKLWGQLVNDARNLSIKVRSFAKVEPDELHHFGRLLVNFARALKEHLREGIRPKQLSLYNRIEAEPTHIPSHVVSMMRDKIRTWKRQGKIDGFDDMILDVHVRSFMDICGSCERIRKTPIAPSYIGFIRQSMVLYLITLPWGLVNNFNYWTIPGAMMVTYFMIGIELTAESVEEPFGRSEDDLVLDEICQSIELSVTEILSQGPSKV